MLQNHKKKQVICIIKIYLQYLFSGSKIVLLNIMYVIPIKPCSTVSSMNLI